MNIAIKEKSKLYTVISILLICIVSVVIYANTFDSEFQFDDEPYILKNPTIRTLGNLEGKLAWLGKPTRVVAFYSLSIDYLFFQYNVFGYHLTNLLIHILTGIGVWWLILLLFRTPKLRDDPLAEHCKAIALITALIFVAHPIQTQAITYIVQRFASLATMFYIWAVCFYLRSRCTEKGVSWPFLILAAVSTLLGMFTKEITFTIPFMILLMEFLFFRSKEGRWLIDQKLRWVILITSALFALIVPALFAFKFKQLFVVSVPSGSNIYELITTPKYFLTQSRVIITYIKLLFFPYTQNLLYDFSLSNSLFEPATMISFGLLGAVFALAILVIKQRIIISFCIFWFFLTLSVESSIIPIHHVIWEHRLYLPSVGFCLLIAVMLHMFFKDYKKMVVATCVLVLTFSYLTYQRNLVWKTAITLWTDVIAKSPRQTRPYLNLGVPYKEAGEYDKAIDIYNRALSIHPTYAEAYNNRGSVYNTLGKYDLAISDFDRAITINPLHANSYSNRGNSYNRKGKFQKAIEDYTKAIELKGGVPEMYSNRGVAYKETGQVDKALADFEKAIELFPSYDEAYNNRSALYISLRKFDLAIKDINETLKVNPRHALAYYNLGIIYSAQKNYNEAINNLSKCISLRPRYINAYIKRSDVYRKMGRFDKAIEDFRIVRDMGNPAYDQYIKVLQRLAGQAK